MERGAGVSPVGYVARSNTQETSDTTCPLGIIHHIRQERSFVEVLKPQIRRLQMFFEGRTVLFFLLQFLVVRSKEILKVCHVRVAGPLTYRWEDECVSVILVLFVGGGASIFTKEGPTTLVKRREFDSTLGYPGEDVHANINR